jgi:hypothetical protein
MDQNELFKNFIYSCPILYLANMGQIMHLSSSILSSPFSFVLSCLACQRHSKIDFILNLIIFFHNRDKLLFDIDLKSLKHDLYGQEIEANG